MSVQMKKAPLISRAPLPGSQSYRYLLQDRWD